MKTPLLFAVSALAITSPCALGVNIITDGGFESNTLPFDGTNSDWNGFAQAPSTAAISGVSPRSGSFSLDLATSADDSFSGVFNDLDVTGLGGTTATYTGWHQLVGDPGGIEIRIEWLAGGTEISRTANFTPTLTSGGAYELFTLSETIPAGTDTARAVYVVSTFGGATTQNVFVDDIGFEVVPEPSSVALFGISALGLIIRRRR